MAAEVVNGQLYISLQTDPSKILRVNRSNGAILSSWYSGGVAATFLPFTGDDRGNLYLSDWLGNSLLAIKVNSNGDPVDFCRLASGTLAYPGWLVWEQINHNQGTVIVIK